MSKLYLLTKGLGLTLGAMGLAQASFAAGWPQDIPRHLICRAAVERVCTIEGCEDEKDPPMEVTVDLATGNGEFCLYTSCGEMFGELDFRGEAAFSGSIDVLATIEGKMNILDYNISFDAQALTFAVIAASGDEVQSYSGKCEPLPAE